MPPTGRPFPPRRRTASRSSPPGVNLHIFDRDLHGGHDAQVAEHLERAIDRDIDPERRHLPVVVCSSRLEPKKNHIGLVLAFAHSPELQAAANLMLVVRGTEDIRRGMGLEGPERELMDQIVQTCEGTGLWGKVAGVSLQNQEELAGAYRHLGQRRSVFALPALYGPFGLAPLEAIAAGLPACVTRHGGPSESLCDAASGEEYGVLVDTDEPGDIARGLLRLVGPDNEWEHFREAGRRRVLARYTWEATARGYLTVLEQILAGPAPTDGLPIPAYFTDPRPENDIGTQALAGFFAAGAARP